MRRFSTLLVANRGEIACRVLRTANALGYRTVAIYSDADAGAPHVALADRAERIGAGPAALSYLDAGRIVQAAAASGAGAVHPGYGFLSENGDFARACARAGLVFVGPDGDVIDAMGNKAEAKRRMRSAGVECVPGYEGEDQSDAAFGEAAAGLGWPVMVKAAAGGGGRGMRLVHSADALPAALARARSEAQQAFGSGELILEKAIERARHVEVQVFADEHGTIVHLGERDCSVQRRHQKVIEEAPSPAVDAALRQRMGSAAVAAAAAVGYCGAGTVEFLLGPDGAFYFLEMNTRLQVEHPVTEMVTGLDMVALQLQVAQGEPLGLAQADIRLRGHAIEARLYAEDPARDFLPQSGEVALWSAAQGPGVRVDAGVCSGQRVPPYYDPLLAKIVAHGADRERARRRLLVALCSSAVLGLRTNQRFLLACLEHETFAAGAATTAFVAEAREDLVTGSTSFDDAAVAAAIDAQAAYREAREAAVQVAPELSNWSSSALSVAREQRWRAGDTVIAVRVTGLGPGLWQITGDDARAVVEIRSMGGDAARLCLDGRDVEARFVRPGEGVLYVHVDGRATGFRETSHERGSVVEERGGGRVVAPMHAQVLEVRVATGDVVQEGDELLVLEAMKMQRAVCAPCSGHVVDVAATPGSQVAPDDPLVVIGPAAG